MLPQTSILKVFMLLCTLVRKCLFSKKKFLWKAFAGIKNSYLDIKRALYPEMLTKRVERGKLLYFHGGWQPYGQYSCSANGLKLRFSRAH